MKETKNGRWIRAGLGIAFLLIGGVSFISYENASQLTVSSEQFQRTNASLQSLNHVCATLTEIEAKRWRYILFQSEEDLEQYRVAINTLNAQVIQLQEILSKDPTQRQSAETLKGLVSTQIELFQKSSVASKQPVDAVQKSLVERLKNNQDAIIRVIAQLRASEEELLQAQLQQSQTVLHLRRLIEVLGTVLTFFVLLAVYVLLYQQMVQRQRAEALQRGLAQEKELSEMKIQFFSMVSHEFRTPLSLILGSVQLLSEDLKPTLNAEKRKDLNRIHTSAKHISQLLDNVLTLARADAGELEFHPSCVEIQTFCLNLIEDFQLFSRSSRLIKFVYQGSITHAWVDEKLLYSILSNLLSNAIKYSPPESTIYFIFKGEPENIKIQIKDEGIGIDVEEQQNLYNPFSRGSNTKETSGTGLGLAIVRKAVNLHQGQIFVESDIGKGTTFTVQIPQSHHTDCRSLSA